MPHGNITMLHHSTQMQNIFLSGIKNVPFSFSTQQPNQCAFQMIYYHCSISTFPRAHTYKFRHHRQTFSSFLYCFCLHFQTLLCIQMTQRSFTVTTTAQCQEEEGRGVLCVDWAKLRKDPKKRSSNKAHQPGCSSAWSIGPSWLSESRSRQFCIQLKDKM